MVGTPPEVQLAVHDLVTSGSGHRLVVTSSAGTSTLALTVYDGSDPTVVNSALVDFDSPGDMRSVVMHQGLALVSDTEEDMQIINFLGQDPLEEVPSLTVESPFEAESMQVENDEVTWLFVDVSDNHLVRNVELYLDGQLYSSDGNFPFEFVYIPPSLTENKNSYTALARAYDMDGFIADSEILTIDVVDTIPPILIDFNPSDGSYHYEEDEIDRVSLFSNELLDSSAFNGSTFTLLEAGEDDTFDTGDDVMIAGTLTFDPEILELSLSLDAPLTKGQYRASVAPVSDISGNLLNETTSWTFEVRVTNIWISETGGTFGVADNWSEGAIRPFDRLIIDAPGEPVSVSYNSGSYTIDTLHSEENIVIDGRILNLVTEGVINGAFTWKGQSTLDGGGVIWANGGLSVESTGSNKWIKNIQLNVSGESTWTLGSILFQHPRAKLEYAEGSTLLIENENFINLVANASDAPIGLINNGAFIKRGPSDFRVSDLLFQHNGSIDIEDGVFEVFRSRMRGLGTIVVRDGATFAAQGRSSLSEYFPILESPLIIEEGGSFNLKAAYLETADGIGITGNGTIDLGDGTGIYANVGSTLVSNGNVTAKHFNMRYSSKAILDGTTVVETLLMEMNDQGELGGTGIFDVTGEMTWNFGYMDGGGITKLRVPVTINQDFGVGLGNRTVEIYDTFTADGGFMRIRSGTKSTLHVMPGGNLHPQRRLSVSSRRSMVGHLYNQ